MIRAENPPSRRAAERNGMTVWKEVTWRGLPHYVYSVERERIYRHWRRDKRSAPNCAALKTGAGARSKKQVLRFAQDDKFSRDGEFSQDNKFSWDDKFSWDGEFYVPLHQILHLQLPHSALPCLAKFPLHKPGIGISILRLQRPMQTKQRPWIPKILCQVLPEHLLR